MCLNYFSKGQQNDISYLLEQVIQAYLLLLHRFYAAETWLVLQNLM